ncbi:DUF1499 domain-containing protein [Marinomonas sp. 15G1-11]|uniref:DUF1499 domain-containing protein n=1 Tax=Marinomonas phaeophyticola TaxID=3004091 RepID=A0ABT4JQC5_9GAMM|nr:DUF1499 domain-containing protein [Marinomonas sp. 15G1-11]MCZ2720576.1 DUF1499 domain-containing protein [Marinomonas sp. 15G1-11]
MFRWILVFITALFVGFLFYININNDRPENLGITDGLLMPCPTSPNCISSQAEVSDEVHYVEPIIYKQSYLEMQLLLEKYFLDQGNARIVSSELGYFYVEIKSSFFGFVDDVELYWPEADSVLHIRSASRVGYSDMDVNRDRVLKMKEFISSYQQ